MKHEYTMTIGEHGIIIREPIPLGDIKALTLFAKRMGFETMDVSYAQAIGATMVITSKDGSAKFRADLDRRNAHLSKEDRWLKGSDVGNSSKTIFQVMTGRTIGSKGEYPYDPGDFGRCYRLLELFPEWKPRLEEIGKRYKGVWQRYVENWKDMESLFLTKQHEDLFRLMNSIRA